MTEFKDGDMVRHRSEKYNHGLAMQVTDVKEDKVRCEWFEGSESVHKAEWFDKNDLIPISEVERGFRNEGK